MAGLGAEQTGSLALQLSLLDGHDAIQYLFDAGNDAEVAAVLRRSVPSLGLRGKLFGATPDAALLWRAADVIVARPKPEVIARVLLVGGGSLVTGCGCGLRAPSEQPSPNPSIATMEINARLMASSSAARWPSSS